MGDGEREQWKNSEREQWENSRDSMLTASSDERQVGSVEKDSDESDSVKVQKERG